MHTYINENHESHSLQEQSQSRIWDKQASCVIQMLIFLIYETTGMLLILQLYPCATFVQPYQRTSTVPPCLSGHNL